MFSYQYYLSPSNLEHHFLDRVQIQHLYFQTATRNNHSQQQDLQLR